VATFNRNAWPLCSGACSKPLDYSAARLWGAKTIIPEIAALTLGIPVLYLAYGLAAAISAVLGWMALHVVMRVAIEKPGITTTWQKFLSRTLAQGAVFAPYLLVPLLFNHAPLVGFLLQTIPGFAILGAGLLLTALPHFLYDVHELFIKGLVFHTPGVNQIYNQRLRYFDKHPEQRQMYLNILGALTNRLLKQVQTSASYDPKAMLKHLVVPAFGPIKQVMATQEPDYVSGMLERLAVRAGNESHTQARVEKNESQTEYKIVFYLPEGLWESFIAVEENSEEDLRAHLIRLRVRLELEEASAQVAKDMREVKQDFDYLQFEDEETKLDFLYQTQTRQEPIAPLVYNRAAAQAPASAQNQGRVAKQSVAWLCLALDNILGNQGGVVDKGKLKTFMRSLKNSNFPATPDRVFMELSASGVSVLTARGMKLAAAMAATQAGRVALAQALMMLDAGVELPEAAKNAEAWEFPELDEKTAKAMVESLGDPADEAVQAQAIFGFIKDWQKQGKGLLQAEGLESTKQSLVIESKATEGALGQTRKTAPELVLLLGKDADTGEDNYLFTSIEPQFGEKYVPHFGTMSEEQKEAVAQADIAQVEYAPYLDSNFYLNPLESQPAYSEEGASAILGEHPIQGKGTTAIQEALTTANSGLVIAMRNFESTPKPAKDHSESIVWEVFYNLILNNASQQENLGGPKITDLEYAFKQITARLADKLEVGINSKYGQTEDEEKRTLPLPRCVYLGKHALTGRIVELWEKMGYAVPENEAERDQMLRRWFNSFNVAA
jgi:hypothetical protein